MTGWTLKENASSEAQGARSLAISIATRDDESDFSLRSVLHKVAIHASQLWSALTITEQGIASSHLTRQSMTSQDWTHPQHPEFTLSTRKDLLDLAAVNDALDSDMVYWGARLPEDVLRKMLDNALSFGLYHTGPDGGKSSCRKSKTSTHLCSPQTNRARASRHGRSLFCIPHRLLLSQTVPRQRSRQLDITDIGRHLCYLAASSTSDVYH